LNRLLTHPSWEATNVGFNLISLVLTILEIARKATERLTPFTMVASRMSNLCCLLPFQGCLGSRTCSRDSNLTLE
jgi:hypothetical protein